MKTFEQAQAQVQALHSTNYERYLTIRRIASRDLERELIEWLGDNHGQGISSSDVSCHLIEMVQYGELTLDNPSQV